MRYKELLNEMIWDDASTAASAAKKYPRDFIHFSHIQKLGVNPSKQHRDPPGVYFYPIKWLLSEDSSLSQYGTGMEYFFIARLKKSAKILNLGKMKIEEVISIATANGWIDEFKAIQANPAVINGAIRNLDKRILRKPGGIFYAAMDYLANVKGKPWLPMVKGYNGLFDPGYGIISNGEHSQIVVFGTQFFTVLEQGKNDVNEMREYGKILEQIAKELNGKFYWLNKIPMADFVIDGKPVKIALDFEKSGNILLSSYEQGFWIIKREKYSTYAGDRANHYSSIKNYIMRAARGGDAEGNEFYWNGQTINELFGLLNRSKRVNQNIKDDSLHAWLVIDSLGGSRAAIIADVTPNDELQIKIDFWLSLSGEYESMVSRVFPSKTPLDVVAKTLLDDFRNDQNRAKNPEAMLEYLRKNFWFNI